MGHHPDTFTISLDVKCGCCTYERIICMRVYLTTCTKPLKLTCYPWIAAVMMGMVSSLGLTQTGWPTCPCPYLGLLYSHRRRQRRWGGGGEVGNFIALDLFYGLKWLLSFGGIVKILWPLPRLFFCQSYRKCKYHCHGYNNSIQDCPCVCVFLFVGPTPQKPNQISCDNSSFGHHPSIGFDFGNSEELEHPRRDGYENLTPMSSSSLSCGSSTFLQRGNDELAFLGAICHTYVGK